MRDVGFRWWKIVIPAVALLGVAAVVPVLVNQSNKRPSVAGFQSPGSQVAVPSPGNPRTQEERPLIAAGGSYTGRRQPCSMLSTGEASEALGVPIASIEQLGTRACRYTYGSNGQHFDVEYTWQGGGTTMRLTRDAMQHVAGTDTFKPIEGIGDEAYLAPGNSALMMRKGDVMVNIDLRESGMSAEGAGKIVRKIASRL